MASEAIALNRGRLALKSEAVALTRIGLARRLQMISWSCRGVSTGGENVQQTKAYSSLFYPNYHQSFCYPFDESLPQNRLVRFVGPDHPRW